MRWAGTTGGGAAGALFMGLTMGVVAAPCVGPIVLGLLVFVGSRQDVSLGFLLFFALAVGMGSPYVVLAMAAGSIKSLPRSGEWLIWTERLFGCVLISLAAYFVAPLLPLPWSTYLLPSVIGASGVYLGFIEAAGRSLRYFPSLKRAVGVVLLALAVWMAQPASSDQAIGWEDLQALAGEDRGPQGKPTLIDFAAEWCIPCREMDHTTYVDEDVVQEAERFRMVKADITEENETTTKVVEKYGVRGVPTVILLAANGAERDRLVGYVGPDELLKAMRQVD
jgi:thiol:disulfide interchange protein DsbD